ncbi:MAG: acyltransferase [Casimicrobiaceae bacterium]
MPLRADHAPDVVAPANRRFVALDAWRGIAALVVVYGHYTAGRLGNGAYHLAFYLAVDFFFILSGFVLAHRYWNDLTLARGGRFMPVVSARIARLYPAHVFTLFALALAFGIEAIPKIQAGASLLGAWAAAIPDWPGGGKLFTFFLNLFLLQNVGFTPTGLTWNVPSWSISVEFFGSLAVLGLVACWRGRGLRVALVTLMSAGYSMVYAFKGQLDATYETVWQVVNLGLVRCVAGIALGVLCLLFLRRHAAHWPVGTAGTTALEIATIVAALTLLIRPEFHSARDAAFPVVSAILIGVFSLESGWIAHLLRQAPFAYLGSLSYAIYLVHWPLQFVMVEQYKLSAALYFAAVAVASVLVHHAIEVPGRRVLRQVLSRRLGPPPNLDERPSHVAS